MNFEELKLEQCNFIPKTKTNVMELLVAQEIKKQIEHYPAQIKEYINEVEVAAYALNRLPPLYASSEEGVYRQKQIALREYRHQISNVVRQSLDTVQAQPLRFSTPLEETRESIE